MKETIRDKINSQLPPKESFNAFHSSHHAAEAWHLIEELAPELLNEVRIRLQQIYNEEERPATLRPAA